MGERAFNAARMHGLNRLWLVALRIGVFENEAVRRSLLLKFLKQVVACWAARRLTAHLL